jgi:hypothetical protein
MAIRLGMKANSHLSVRSHDVCAVLWGKSGLERDISSESLLSLTEKKQSLVNKNSQQPTAKRAFVFKTRSAGRS